MTSIDYLLHVPPTFYYNGRLYIASGNFTLNAKGAVIITVSCQRRICVYFYVGTPSRVLICDTHLQKRVVQLSCKGYIIPSSFGYLASLVSRFHAPVSHKDRLHVKEVRGLQPSFVYTGLGTRLPSINPDFTTTTCASVRM